MSDYPFIQARYETVANRKTVDYIIIHAMQLPCKAGIAMRCAQGFQKEMDPGKGKSCHWCIDPENIVQCVHEYNIAWHCPKGNSRGVGFELSAYGPGVPSQSIEATDWNSDEAQALIKNAATVTAATAKRWSIPVVKLSVEDIQGSTLRGFAGHVDFSNAFQTPGGHQDPGPDFPWDQFIELVKAAG